MSNYRKQDVKNETKHNQEAIKNIIENLIKNYELGFKMDGRGMIVNLPENDYEYLRYSRRISGYHLEQQITYADYLKYRERLENLFSINIRKIRRGEN